MALPAFITSLFSWNPGFALQDGNALQKLTNLVFSAQSGIVAHAGGGQALATPLTAAFNQIDVCATNSDSVMLPPAIPGSQVTVYNASANTLAVFGVPANGANAGAGDTIAIEGTITQQPTATGVTQATAVITDYVCFKLGQWVQNAIT